VATANWTDSRLFTAESDAGEALASPDSVEVSALTGASLEEDWFSADLFDSSLGADPDISAEVLEAS